LRAGARVVALAGGAAKLKVLRDLLPGESLEGEAQSGTDRLALVDYSAPGWLDEARAALGASGATLVLDGVGGDLGTAATGLLRRADGADAGSGVTPGRLVAYGWASGTANRYTSWAEADRIESPIEVRYAVGPEAPPMGDQRPYQERALAMAASGRWRVVTHRVPFAEAARAHRELEERRTTGKVVLV
ncbi:zinc-binding dehydrogenase, partial [Promicromonospora kroppenstedtii]|uniref:zinc-binding dehydrogenase n=1 Tax=Promicromonospora kroppenstedtii TaxID=440482 RepID=UPI0012FB634F